MSHVKNMDMLNTGTLVNVSWQWYLPGASLEKNPFLNEVYAYCMGKRTRYVLVPIIDKVVALTRSPVAIPGTKNYFMDIGQ